MAKVNTDGYVDLEFNADRTQVYATITPPQGDGDPVSAKEVIDRMRSMGVIYGFLEAQVMKATKVASEEQTTAVKILVAQGVLPQDGIDAQVTWKVDEALTRQRLPRRPDGTLDFFSLDPARVVKAGQELIAVIPARPGTPGKTLTAPLSAVRQVAGRDVTLNAGQGVALSDDHLRFVATDDGFLELIGDRLTVHAIKIVEGDVMTGRHEFPAGVVVLGDVRSSAITAKGIIAVRGAVVGSRLRSHADIYVTKAANAELISDVNIHVQDVLANCSVNAREKLIAADKSVIYGGNLVATEGVIADTVGNTEYAETHITVGVDNISELRLAEVTAQMTNYEMNIAKIDQVIKPLAALPHDQLPPDKRSLIQQLKDQRKALEMRINDIHNLKRTLTVRGRTQSDAVVAVRSVVYPGVYIHIRNATLLVEEPVKAVSYVADPSGKSVYPRSM